jgi:hypothetical protein
MIKVTIDGKTEKSKKLIELLKAFPKNDIFRIVGEPTGKSDNSLKEQDFSIDELLKKISEL